MDLSVRYACASCHKAWTRDTWASFKTINDNIAKIQEVRTRFREASLELPVKSLKAIDILKPDWEPVAVPAEDHAADALAYLAKQNDALIASMGVSKEALEGIKRGFDRAAAESDAALRDRIVSQREGERGSIAGLRRELTKILWNIDSIECDITIDKYETDNTFIIWLGFTAGQVDGYVKALSWKPAIRSVIRDHFPVHCVLKEIRIVISEKPTDDREVFDFDSNEHFLERLKRKLRTKYGDA